jgi:hypothetical protein
MPNGLDSALTKLSKCHSAPKWVADLYRENNEVYASLTPVEILAVRYAGLRISQPIVDWAVECKAKGLCRPYPVWVGPLDTVLELTSRFAGGDFNG